MEAKKKKISSWDEADKLVREYSKAQVAVKYREGIAKKEKDKVQDSLARAVATRVALMEQIRKAIELFASKHRPDFKGKRSKKLNFGTVSWKENKRVDMEDDTLALIKKKFPKRGFIKLVPTINTDEVRNTLNKKELASIHAKVNPDEFKIQCPVPKAAKH